MLTVQNINQCYDSYIESIHVSISIRNRAINLYNRLQKTKQTQQK